MASTNIALLTSNPYPNSEEYGKEEARTHTHYIYICLLKGKIREREAFQHATLAKCKYNVSTHSIILLVRKLAGQTKAHSNAFSVHHSLE